MNDESKNKTTLFVGWFTFKYQAKQDVQLVY